MKNNFLTIFKISYFFYFACMVILLFMYIFNTKGNIDRFGDKIIIIMILVSLFVQIPLFINLQKNESFNLFKALLIIVNFTIPFFGF